MSYPIKELGVGGILDLALRIIRDNFGVLVPIVLCLVVPLQLMIGFYNLSMIPDVPPGTSPEEAMMIQIEASSTVLPVSIIGSLLYAYVAVPITSAALIFAIAELYLGNKPSLGESFRKGFSRFLPLMGTTILYTLAIMGGFILLIIPGIIAMLWFYLYQQVVVLENKAGTKALGRSRELMKGNLGKVVAIAFLVIILVLGVQMCANFIPQPHVSLVAEVVLQGFALMFYAAVGVVLYFSCLCQHEDFDLRRLAEAVGEADPIAEPDNSLGL